MSEYFTLTASETMRPSPTMGAGNMAQEAKAKGRAVEVCTIGDLFPKPTPEELKDWQDRLRQAALDPINAKDPVFTGMRNARNEYAYSESAGLPPLRETVARCFTRDTGLSATAADVRIGTGGKGALNGALANSLKAGDVVLLPVPGWPSNWDIFPAGVKLVELPTKDGILRAPELKKALKAYPEPALVLINAPNNPTGANYTPEEREAFFEALNQETKKTLVASDDPYGKLVYDRVPFDLAAVLRRGPAEKTMFDVGRLAVFRTVSKEYGLPGLRVGFVITRNKAMLSSLQLWNENRGGIGSADQIMAQAALLYGDGFILRTMDLLKQKRQMLVDGIAKLQYARMDAPMGTIYGWVDFSALKGKTVPVSLSDSGSAYRLDTPADLARYLVFSAGVCGVPGVPFYAEGSPNGAQDWHVRITFCGEIDSLQRVLSNLQQAESQLEDSAAAKRA